MKYIVTDTELGIDIASFDSAGEARTFVGTMGQDGSLKVTRH